MKSSLHIAFFGSSLVSSYWNGAATYYRGIIRALHARGHYVTFYEPDAFDRQLNRDMDEPEWANVVVYSASSAEEVRKLVRQASSADVVVKASGVGVHDELLEAAVLEFRRERSKVIFWDVDAPATLERVQLDGDDPFRKLIPQYDLILTYGGGHPVRQAYRALGARQCEAIYNALDPDSHHPVDTDPRYAADLVFLGNRLPDRELRVEKFFLQVANEMKDRDFVLGGSGWEGKALSPNVNYVGHVSTNLHNAFNCSPMAVLNISRDSMARFGFSPATRIFEAAGAAACIITDYWEGIENFLEPNAEILVARDHREVIRHLEMLTRERAAVIGQAARRRILKDHTYQNRVAQLEKLLEAPESLITLKR